MQESFAMQGSQHVWPIRHFARYVYYLKYIWYHWELYCTEEDKIMEHINEALEALSVRLGKAESFYNSGYILILCT